VPDVAASKRAGAKRLLKACFNGTQALLRIQQHNPVKRFDVQRRIKAEYPYVPSSFRLYSAFDAVSDLL
jgi:hypothetical protein